MMLVESTRTTRDLNVDMIVRLPPGEMVNAVRDVAVVPPRSTLTKR